MQGNKIFLFLFLGMFLLSFVSAYDPHKIGEDLEFSITSNFATSCELTTINTPNGIIEIGQTDTDTRTFNFIVLGGNYSTSGTYCHNLVCTDGVDTASGQECRDVNLSGVSQNMTLIISEIFLVVLISILIWILHLKYRNTNYKEMNIKISESHDGNWGKTFIKTIGNNIMRNSFLWYYSLGWFLLIVLRDLIYNFNTEEIYNFFTLFLDIYSFGFFLVIIVWIGILIHHFRFITDMINDLNLGVDK
jgi:hypothetical protein